MPLFSSNRAGVPLPSSFLFLEWFSQGLGKLGWELGSRGTRGRTTKIQKEGLQVKCGRGLDDILMIFVLFVLLQVSLKFVTGNEMQF